VSVALQTARVSAEPSESTVGAPPISVVLAEDHELMRARLRSLLEDDEQIEMMADTGELGEAMASVFSANPRVLVLDMSMPSGSSIDAIRRLRSRLPDTEIVALKMGADAAFARHAFEAGAIAFVLKDTADSELVDAIRCASRGQRYLSPRIAAARQDASCPAAGEAGRPVGSSARTVVPPAALESSSNVPPAR
jgi:two-component system, NarL family, response regulator NreC